MKMCWKNSGPRRDFSKVFWQILESCQFIWPLVNFPCQVDARYMGLASGSFNLVENRIHTCGAKFFTWWKNWLKNVEYMTRIFVHHFTSRVFRESSESCRRSPGPSEQRNMMTNSWKYDEKHFNAKFENMMKMLARKIRIYNQNFCSSLFV